MNVILTYKQILEFSEDAQKGINNIQFSQIPEMRVIENINEDESVNYTIPYQANVTNEDEFTQLKSMLEGFGVVDIIGKWNEDGSIVEFDINKYKETLNGVKTFGNVDIMGSVEDEEGNVSEVVVKSYISELSSKRPTLAQAKKTQVNTFNKNVTRCLE